MELETCRLAILISILPTIQLQLSLLQIYRRMDLIYR